LSGDNRQAGCGDNSTRAVSSFASEVQKPAGRFVLCSRFSIGYLMTRPTANSKHGARYEIAVGGKPRSYRDVKAVAIESAQDLKSRNPNIEVAVLDLENGETIVIKNRPPRQPNDRAP